MRPGTAAGAMLRTARCFSPGLADAPPRALGHALAPNSATANPPGHARRASSKPGASPRHFLTLRDFPTEVVLGLVKKAMDIKQAVKSGKRPEGLSAQGRTLAMIFSKRSTRTRVSSESGWAWYGGHTMFLNPQDIQIGAGEPMQDTSIVISSMVDGILARLGGHEEIEQLAKYSSVPVINALTAKFHPLQILADLVTMYEVSPPAAGSGDKSLPLPPFKRYKVAWVGDANNISQSMLVTFPRVGIDLSLATPPKYKFDQDVLDFATRNAAGGSDASPFAGSVSFTSDPVEAVRDADVIVTDTWVSMGQEDEKKERLKAFDGYKVTEELARKGGAKPDWKFMHCLPRKMEEVDDEVFYNPKRSIVWQEAENRKYTVMAVYEEFLLKRRN
ncbi:mitochondrial ornithine carbamoyltransferase [Hyaloraphidium curvatum]|nr:mitochondrial ornithine carbamoyltransferase [Hyaloraphidium curvatum]